MLQLLLERGQSYDDLASLLGIDEAEVRTRARAALTELTGADPDRSVGLTDYLLGQADPIGRADAVRHLKDDAEDLDLARELSQKLRLLAPEAELPRLPGEERRPRPRGARRLPAPGLRLPRRLRRTAPTEAGAEARRGPRTTLSRRQTQFLVALGSGAVLIVAVVLALAGAFAGSGSESTATTASSTTTTPLTNTGNLEGFPLGLNVKSATFQDTIPVPAALRPVLSRIQAVYVTLAKSKSVLAAVQQAVKDRSAVLPVQGKPLLAGVLSRQSQNVLAAQLQAAKGVKGSGAVALGQANQTPFLQIKLTNLKPPSQGQAYIAWLVLA